MVEFNTGRPFAFDPVQVLPQKAGRRTGRKVIDLAGKRFGRWTALRYAGSALWLVRCDCGAQKTVNGGSLRNGETKSCGCLQSELITKRNTTHGKYRGPLYAKWRSMKQRCADKNCKDYPRYGGRGISVCQRWQDYSNFVADMWPSYPGSGYSLDRIDNDGNYEPSNCRWASSKEQGSNRRDNVVVELGNQKMSLVEFSRKRGVSYNALWKRYKSQGLIAAMEWAGRKHLLGEANNAN